MSSRSDNSRINKISKMTLEISREILEFFKKQGWTISFAESCTGGLLSSEFVSLEGISDIFKGSIVSYCNEIKISHLEVSPKLLESKGAVNEEVALQMAKAVRSRFRTDWAVSITGVASSSSHPKDPSTGTVCFAVSSPYHNKSLLEVFQGARDEIRHQATLKALQFLKEEAKDLKS